MRKAAPAASAAVLALAMGACGGSTVPSEVTVVEWTSSFGFCPPDAYCTTRLSVSGADAVVTLESRELPPVQRNVQLGAGEALALSRAAARAEFEGLPPVIGCPDCADGGAETLSVTSGGEQDTVTFEYSTAVPALEPLLSQVRALVQRLRPTP